MNKNTKEGLLYWASEHPVATVLIVMSVTSVLTACVGKIPTTVRHKYITIRK